MNDPAIKAGSEVDWREAVVSSLDQLIAEMRQTLDRIRAEIDLPEGASSNVLPLDKEAARAIADLERQIDLAQQTRAVAMEQLR